MDGPNFYLKNIIFLEKKKLKIKIMMYARGDTFFMNAYEKIVDF